MFREYIAATSLLMTKAESAMVIESLQVNVIDKEEEILLEAFLKLRLSHDVEERSAYFLPSSPAQVNPALRFSQRTPY